MKIFQILWPTKISIMRFTYSSFTRRHRWLEGSASRCSWVTEELSVEAGLHSPLLDQSVRLYLDSWLDYSCNHLGVARHVACWQSRRWRWEHFRSAGVPNHFAVLGINPVLGLTLQDICDAYIRAQRHVLDNGMHYLLREGHGFRTPIRLRRRCHPLQNYLIG